MVARSGLANVIRTNKAVVGAKRAVRHRRERVTVAFRSDRIAGSRVAIVIESAAVGHGSAHADTGLTGLTGQASITVITTEAFIGRVVFTEARVADILGAFIKVLAVTVDEAVEAEIAALVTVLTRAGIATAHAHAAAAGVGGCAKQQIITGGPV